MERISAQFAVGTMEGYEQAALALTQGLQVNACGRIVDISPDGATSMMMLRRELVRKLKVCNASSLQVTDITGQPMVSDVDLANAMRDNKLPLQAKLTVSALHEIEQKKKEGRNKEQDMLGLQWQIVIEQVAAFSNELAAMGSHLQTVHDDSRKIVAQFDQESRLRRTQLMAQIKEETLEREGGQRDIMVKLDEVINMVMEEKSGREVSDYQLQKQIETVFGEINACRTTFDHDHAAFNRVTTAMRLDLDAECQRNGINWNRWNDTLKRIEAKEQEQHSQSLFQMQRISVSEAEIKKLRSDVDTLEATLSRQARETHAQFKRHGEELMRSIQDGTFGTGHEVACVAKDNEASWQNIERQLLQVREEHARAIFDFDERTRILDLRCTAVENEASDKLHAINNKDNHWADQVTMLISNQDNAKLERYALDASLRATSQKVEELMERMRHAELALNQKVSAEHWKAQLNSLTQMFLQQESTLKHLDRDVDTRLAREQKRLADMAASQELAIDTLHGTVKTCIDRVAEKVPGSIEKLSLPDTRGHGASFSQAYTPAEKNSVSASSVVDNGRRCLSPVRTTVFPPGQGPVMATSRSSSFLGYPNQKLQMNSTPQSQGNAIPVVRHATLVSLSGGNSMTSCSAGAPPPVRS